MITFERRHLEQATRHIGEAQARMSLLEDRIARSLEKGWDTAQADALMRHMTLTLQLMIRHRLQIRCALQGKSN